MSDGPQSNSEKPSTPPDPEVSSKPRRRRFTAAYKLKVLRELDACAPGEQGAILRREGLYTSHITDWRRKRAAGELQGLTSSPGGRPRRPRSAADSELERMRRVQRQLEWPQVRQLEWPVPGRMANPCGDLAGSPW